MHSSIKVTCRFYVVIELIDDEGYYCFGYANKSVKNEFKSYFMNFSTLAAAIDSLIFFGDNLYSRNTFMGNDVKYKLRAKASSQDDPGKVNEALLRLYSFVKRSKYKSMGRVIEKNLMVRKEIISKKYYPACEELKDFCYSCSFKLWFDLTLLFVSELS